MRSTRVLVSARQRPDQRMSPARLSNSTCSRMTQWVMPRSQTAEWADRVAVRMPARWGLRHELAWAPRLEHDARRLPSDGNTGPRPQHLFDAGDHQLRGPVDPVARPFPPYGRERNRT